MHVLCLLHARIYLCPVPTVFCCCNLLLQMLLCISKFKHPWQQLSSLNRMLRNIRLSTSLCAGACGTQATLGSTKAPIAGSIVCHPQGLATGTLSKGAATPPVTCTQNISLADYFMSNCAFLASTIAGLVLTCLDNADAEHLHAVILTDTSPHLPSFP